ncbi:alpha/beta hydrolase [Marilutibacter alkalisoli]|uniref:alpha/beta hydrolase n=1 Tax=Marilutibacter alkalisoli TaxID=2591633 RepID=UPI001ABEA7B4|nr:alpha/beta hydrolase [Lysobacter alkalisoli]
MPGPVRALLTIAGLLLLAWLGLCTLMFMRQRDFVYFPAATRVEAGQTDFAFDNEGITLRGWVVNPGQPRALLYFGGNAEAIQHNREAFARWFPDHTVYLVAYRGYGASQGQPGEVPLSSDAVALHDHVSGQHKGIDVVGRSLGSGVAAHLASQRPVGRLALVTPFDSLAGVGQHHYPWLPVRLLARDRYDSATRLTAFEGPVLVIQAGRDRVIPASSTRRLIDALPAARSEVVMVPEAGHNDIDMYPSYGEALAAFMRGGSDGRGHGDGGDASAGQRGTPPPTTQ